MSNRSTTVAARRERIRAIAAVESAIIDLHHAAASFERAGLDGSAAHTRDFALKLEAALHAGRVAGSHS